MGESNGSESSKTSLCCNEDGGESECNNEEESRRSSSKSSVEENNNDNKKKSVRPYVRSKLPRLRWTHDLHLRFIHAVQRLGGQEKATPKLVLQMMNIKGLSIAHVKSHLQMYRSKKLEDTNQVLGDHRLMVESEDRNIYNLSQIPMLQGYNPTQNSAYRYGYGGLVYENMANSPFMARIPLDESRVGPYRRMTEKIQQQPSFCSTRWSQLMTEKIYESKDEEFISFVNEVRPIIRAKEPTPNNNVALKTLKRKGSEVDLDLSLKLNTSKVTCEEQESMVEDLEVDSNLSLSLFCQSPSSYYLSKRLKETQNHCKDKRVSDLNLRI